MDPRKRPVAVVLLLGGVAVEEATVPRRRRLRPRPLLHRLLHRGIWHIAIDTEATMTSSDVAFRASANIASFAEDTNGELLIVDVTSGTLYRLVAG